MFSPTEDTITSTVMESRSSTEIGSNVKIAAVSSSPTPKLTHSRSFNPPQQSPVASRNWGKKKRATGTIQASARSAKRFRKLGPGSRSSDNFRPVLRPLRACVGRLRRRRLRAQPLGGERDRHGGADAQRAVDGERAAMLLDQHLGERQAQAG